MRYLIPLLLLSACGTVQFGSIELTPAQRCFGYTAALGRLDAKLATGETLNSVQQLEYDLATVGMAATCSFPAPE